MPTFETQLSGVPWMTATRQWDIVSTTPGPRLTVSIAN